MDGGSRKLDYLSRKKHVALNDFSSNGCRSRDTRIITVSAAWRDPFMTAPRKSILTSHKPHHHHHAHYHPDPAHTQDDHHITEYEGPLEDHPLWQRDNVVLVSVGIDIGSAGTQVLFSRIHMKRQSVDLSSRFLVVERDTLFESAISITPYESDTRIDARAIGEIVDAAYYEAGLTPNVVDTGIVILTGEALRRENAGRIARVLSEKCGDLVCETAGHHMEAMLAAHGSGAVQASHDREQVILNIDIGGGTTKLAVVDRGRIVSTAAVHVGGRLVAIDDDARVQRLDPAGRTHAERAGVELAIGEPVSDASLDAIAVSMADDLVAALTESLSEADIELLYLTDPAESLDRVEAVVCSGGVAEFIYDREKGDFGDLGRRLGREFRRRFDNGELRWPLLTDSFGIRSTALGCSEFSAQLSGNTGYISNRQSLLPRRNMKVLRPHFEFTDDFDPDELAEAIRNHLTMFEVTDTDSKAVLAFQWQGEPKHARVLAFAEGLRRGVAARTANGLPIYVILDGDIAMNLGRVLHQELDLDVDIMVIDGLELWDFDSVDIGKVREPSMTVPVTIKSLVFSDVEGGVHRRELIHHPRGRSSQPKGAADA